MWQGFIVIIILGIASFFIIRYFLRALSTQESSACACCAGGCSVQEPEELNALCRDAGEEKTSTVNQNSFG